MSYNFKKIEEKWQKKWEKEKIFAAKEGPTPKGVHQGGASSSSSPRDISKKMSTKGKFYVLEMYPYPSASGLHMGHAFNYTIGDVYARFKRMQGNQVLYPMGFDSFGLPAENAAIKAKSHPKPFTEKAIKNYIKQMKGLGLSYDWDRTLMSHDPE